MEIFISDKRCFTKIQGMLYTTFQQIINFLRKRDLKTHKMINLGYNLNYTGKPELNFVAFILS